MSDIEMTKEIADKIGARIKEVITDFDKDVTSANIFIKIGGKVNLRIYKGNLPEAIFNNTMERVSLDQNVLEFMSGDK